jgi:hypothetical protein
LERKVALGMKQKIEHLKVRRRKERINLILTAASNGDLDGLDHFFQASYCLVIIIPRAYEY